jgi:ABC-type sulfate/molybdate transport systems ATPase subunit
MSDDAARGLHVDATVSLGGQSLSARFDVPPSSTLALTGSQDAGTIIVRAIAGRLPISEGTIVLEGVTISKPGSTMSRERRRVGAVFDGYRLSSRLNVRDHVATVFRRRGVPLAIARKDAQPWLERYELDHLANLRASDLEPAQRMSLALARALASDPAALVLDDPLGPLSDKPAARTSLARLLRDFGRPVVIATRDPNDIAALAAHSIAVSGWH